MKKYILFAIMTIVLLCLLCGCNMILMDYHPTKHTMSKWEGDGIELYILDEGINDGNDLIVINSGSEKMFFDVWWHGNGLWNLDMIDRRTPVSEFNDESEDFSSRRSVGDFDLTVLSPKKCKLKLYIEQNFPEDFLPDEIVLKRTATNLSPDDIPKIEMNDSYSFCPTYSYVSEWVSDDSQINIKILSGMKSEKGVGEVTILGDTETKMYMKFHEYNSMAYLGQFEDDSAFSRIDVRQTKEQWHCEYYEDYFIATVVCSERYSPGQIFRFNKK